MHTYGCLYQVLLCLIFLNYRLMWCFMIEQILWHYTLNIIKPRTRLPFSVQGQIQQFIETVLSKYLCIDKSRFSSEVSMKSTIHLLSNKKYIYVLLMIRKLGTPFLGTSDNVLFLLRDLVAHGQQNVWICEVGSKRLNGSFEAFLQNILDSGKLIKRLAYTGINITFKIVTM